MRVLWVSAHVAYITIVGTFNSSSLTTSRLCGAVRLNSVEFHKFRNVLEVFGERSAKAQVQYSSKWGLYKVMGTGGDTACRRSCKYVC